jgi:hypothetical protein
MSRRGPMTGIGGGVVAVTGDRRRAAIGLA